MDTCTLGNSQELQFIVTSDKKTSMTNMRRNHFKINLSSQTCFNDLSGSLSLSTSQSKLSLIVFPFFFTVSLLNLPDGDFAVSPGGAAQDVAVLGGAQRLDAVCVSLQLLGHSVALWVHHQQLSSLLTVTPRRGASCTAAAHPDLTRHQIKPV